MMLRISVISVLLAFAFTGIAQTSPAIQCFEDVTYAEQARIVLPEIHEDAPAEFRVTAIAAEPLLPVVAVVTPQGDTFCNEGDDAAAFYSLRRDGDEPGETAAGAQEIAFDPGLNIAQIGTLDDQTGRLTVIIEGEFTQDDPRGHDYVVMVNGEDPAADALLFTLDGQTEPVLDIAQSGEAGQPAEAIAAELLTDIEESTSAVGAAIPREISLTVRHVAGMRYALVLTFDTGAGQPQPQATVTRGEQGNLMLSCDGTILAENALELMLPTGDEAYTVTALGVGDADPVLAAVDANGSGTCAADSAAAAEYGVSLPELSIAPSNLSAQVQAGETQRIVVADQSGLAGEFVLLVEGAALDSGEDAYSVQITPGMLSAGGELGLYAIALTTELDPALALDAGASALLGEAEPVFCDNAGERATCYGAPPRLNDFGLTLGEDDFLSGYELDAALRLPLGAVAEPVALPFTVRAQRETSGGYVLVVRMVTD